MRRGRPGTRTSALRSRLRTAALSATAVVLGASAAFLAFSTAPAAGGVTNPVRPAAVSAPGFGSPVGHGAALLSDQPETGVATTAPTEHPLANAGSQMRTTLAVGLALLLGGTALVLLTARVGRRDH